MSSFSELPEVPEIQSRRACKSEHLNVNDALPLQQMVVAHVIPRDLCLRRRGERLFRRRETADF